MSNPLDESRNLRHEWQAMSRSLMTAELAALAWRHDNLDTAIREDRAESASLRETLTRAVALLRRVAIGDIGHAMQNDEPFPCLEIHAFLKEIDA